MPELGETTDPRALVPGDPAAVTEVQASMARLGQALLEAGDGLSRIDTADWEGAAADAFRSVFEGVPAQWRGSGEAFVDAADALPDQGGVLAWAQDEATVALREWDQAVVTTDTARREHERLVTEETARSAAEGRPPVWPPFTDPGDVGRRAAQDRLDQARTEVAASGSRADAVVGRARDLAPPSPSVATQAASVVGDVAAGAWQEMSETGQFLWQVDPARFLVEPAAAAAGWGDLVGGATAAVTHPQQAVEGALDPREMATNPARSVGENAVGIALSALSGVGSVKRVHGAAEAGRIAAALDGDDGEPAPSSFRPGTWGGRTAAQHVAEGGEAIGRPGSGKRTKQPVREVDTSEEVDELYRTLSVGGQVTRRDDKVEVTALPDGTYLTHRRAASSTPDGSALDVRDASGTKIRVHIPKPEAK